MNLAFSTFESILCNSYFLIGLLTTIYYWTKIIFFSGSSKFGFIGLSLVNIFIILQLISRWIVSGHFPLSSLYESLIFLAWGINSIYLIIEYMTNNELIGVLVSPILLCILGFTGFSLPLELQEMKPLVPALQSNWLFMHVSVMMLSYAGLLVGSILSIAYLVIYAFLKNRHFFTSQTNCLSSSLINYWPFSGAFHNVNGEKHEEESSPNSSIVSTSPLFFTSGCIIEQNTSNLSSSSSNNMDLSSRIKIETLLTLFDNLSYRTIGIGFCFLTLGILSGAVWANETWGTYWSWDPKETWALITWLTFAVYLHIRFLRGWQGVKPASIAALGFLMVWVCYLGVNILGKGLHTYGFLS